MNEIKYERSQELVAEGEHANACLEAILSDNGSEMTLPALYRSNYKYVECGPWLSVRTWDNRTFHCDQLHKVDKTEVRYLLVGSIVENSDAEIAADWIDLLKCETPEAAVKAFNAAVEWVNDEACALWAESNDNDDGFPGTEPITGCDDWGTGEGRSHGRM